MVVPGYWRSGFQVLRTIKQSDNGICSATTQAISHVTNQAINPTLRPWNCSHCEASNSSACCCLSAFSVSSLIICLLNSSSACCISRAWRCLRASTGLNCSLSCLALSSSSIGVHARRLFRKSGVQGFSSHLTCFAVALAPISWTASHISASLLPSLKPWLSRSSSRVSVSALLLPDLFGMFFFPFYPYRRHRHCLSA